MEDFVALNDGTLVNIYYISSIKPVIYEGKVKYFRVYTNDGGYYNISLEDYNVIYNHLFVKEM
jgi:hypothetical protein